MNKCSINIHNYFHLKACIFWSGIIAMILTSNQLFSQDLNVTIDYSVRTNKANRLLSTQLTYRLLLGDTKSYFWNTEESPKQYIYGPQEVKTEKVGDFIMIPLNDNTMGRIIQDKIYKDYQTNELVYNEIQGSKLVVINEPIDIFTWTIFPKRDTIILGFKCQVARSKFRGREYEAFFSTDLNSKGGPWKFDGLPGVILSIRSLDNYFNVTPLKISRGISSNQQIVNPYKNKNEQMSWEQFCLSEYERLKRLLKFMKSKGQPGETGSINVTDRIEDIGFKKVSY